MDLVLGVVIRCVSGSYLMSPMALACPSPASRHYAVQARAKQSVVRDLHSHPKYTNCRSRDVRKIRNKIMESIDMVSGLKKPKSVAQNPGRDSQAPHHYHHTITRMHKTCVTREKSRKAELFGPSYRRYWQTTSPAGRHRGY